MDSLIFPFHGPKVYDWGLPMTPSYSPLLGYARKVLTVPVSCMALLTPTLRYWQSPPTLLSPLGDQESQ